MPSTLEELRTYHQNIRTSPKDTENYVAGKCWQTEKRRTDCEKDVLNALNRQKNDLFFWKNELEWSIEKLSNERSNVQSCIMNLDHHHNLLSGLVHSVKRCQDLCYFQKGAGNVLAGDDSQKALNEENVLLTKSIEQIEDQKRQAEQLCRRLHYEELALIEDLKFKTGSLEATKKSDSLHLQSDELDQHYKDPVGDPISWKEAIERCLDSSNALLSESCSFRDMVRTLSTDYTMEVTTALCKTSGLLQLDEQLASAAKDRTMALLSQVNEDLVLTREKNVMLRSEIGKQRRHIQAINTRMHLFRIKPSSEQISDEPLSEMLNQIETAKENLVSLEDSYEHWSKKEKDLLLTQMNLRQSLEKASRTFFLYKDEVKGQRRVGSDGTNLVVGRLEK